MRNLRLLILIVIPLFALGVLDAFSRDSVPSSGTQHDPNTESKGSRAVDENKPCFEQKGLETPLPATLRPYGAYPIKSRYDDESKKYIPDSKLGACRVVLTNSHGEPFIELVAGSYISNDFLHLHDGRNCEDSTDQEVFVYLGASNRTPFVRVSCKQDIRYPLKYRKGPHGPIETADIDTPPTAPSSSSNERPHSDFSPERSMAEIPNPSHGSHDHSHPTLPLPPEHHTEAINHIEESIESSGPEKPAEQSNGSVHQTGTQNQQSQTTHSSPRTCFDTLSESAKGAYTCTECSQDLLIFKTWKINTPDPSASCDTVHQRLEPCFAAFSYSKVQDKPEFSQFETACKAAIVKLTADGLGEPGITLSEYLSN